METVIVVVDSKTLEIQSRSEHFYIPELAQRAALEFAESKFPGGKFHYRVWIIAEVRYAFVIIQGRK